MALTKITSTLIKDNAVTTAKINADAVDETKIADNAVITSKINADAVDETKIADNAVITSKINADAVDETKIAAEAVNSEHLVDGGIDDVHLATGIDATKLTGSIANARIPAGAVTQHVTPFDPAQIEMNQAILAFKIASSNQLAKFQMVDQVIDEYQDDTGIDAGNSTNELASGSGTAKYYEGGTSSTPTVTHNADSTGTDGDYTWYKYTSTGAVTLSTNTSQDYDFLVIAGGGAGGSGNNCGGGGGAGGYRNSYASEATGGGGYNEAALSLVASTTYTITVGTGGASVSGITNGNSGSASSITGSDITDITTVGGGGGGNAGGGTGHVGGAGGGAGGWNSTAFGAGTGNQGYAGGTALYHQWSGAGGGGAGAAGVNVATTGNNQSTAGGAGLQSSIDGTATFRGGGGGGAGDATSIVSQAGGVGGGGAGATQQGTAGTANTGGGGGSGGGIASGAGGSGIVILRRLTSGGTSTANLTLQSTATTAESAPTTADLVVLIEDGAGTATVNSDIKGYVSRDGSAFSSAVTFVDEGDWGTNKRILVARNVDISGITSGTSMKYKLTTHNQVASSKETRIHATSLAWA
jgi:hypothetical protein